jgi:hypothetical protein
MRQAIAPLGRRAVRLDARKSGVITFGAPTKGLVTNQNLSNATKEAALQLDNWFPVHAGVRLRGGTSLFATIGTGPVLSMWPYVSGNVEKLFAADASNIFNITSPADPEVAPTADISSLTGGYWSFVQFETAGGDFLVGCNGRDTPRQYDGTTWTSSTMTGSGLTTSALSHVWTFKSRLFFIEDGTMKFWYLPVDSITGTATQFSLAGVFNKGGSLLFGATWSLDAGDGVDDLLVVVSTLGEVAIYQGSDPSSDFQIVGVYSISAPLGKDATIKAGGDLMIATVEGIVPISEVLTKDSSALSLSAVTRAIEPTWHTEVSQRETLPWTMVKWSEKNMLVVGMPSPGPSVDPLSFVANLETGAWCQFTGTTWDVRSQAVLEGVHYVGGATGKVYITETGGSDAGNNYTCTYVNHFSHIGRRGSVKSVNLARAAFRATRAFIAKVSCSINYTVSLPSAPSSVADSTEDAWDEGLWDTAVWDASGSSLVTARWTAISKAGYVIAPQVQVTCGVTPRPDAELMSIDIEYELGGVVV